MLNLPHITNPLEIKSLKAVPFIGEPVYRVDFARANNCLFYDLVPKDRKNNLIFRSNLAIAAFENPEFQAAQWQMCKQDFLYWMNAYARTHDPRVSEKGNSIYGKLGSDLPFITRNYQDEAILKIIDCIEAPKDCVIHKSRDMGASWLLVMICLWYWLFFKDKVFLLMSRKEVLVDRNKPQDKKSMFGKIDHAFKRLPVWMRPTNYTRTLLYFSNDDMGSEITGESTTGDSGRADRATAVIPDEYGSIREADSIDAATARVTGCRIFNSTPKGSSNAFARKCQSPDIEKIVMLWFKNPDFRRGAYRWKDGKLLRLDPKFEYRADYPYVKDGKLRSPWFDTEEKRYGHPTLFAQEVEGDFFSSDFEFFDPKMLTEYQGAVCREPLVRGRLGYGLEGEPTSFNAASSGNLKIWVPFPNDGRPDKTLSYAIGCDIAHGTGASPSVATVGCVETREVVAEYVDSHMDPRTFAVFVVALCRWFRGKDDEGASLVWEGNGPGAAFGKKVWELGYRRFYYRKGGLKPSLDSLGSHDRPSTIGGWYSNEDTRLDLLNQYSEAIKSRRILNRSRESIDECRNFVYTDGGKIIHSKSKDAIDPSASRDSHSDRVISAALLWKVVKELTGGDSVKNKEIPVHSAGYRRLQRQKKREIEELALVGEADLMEEFA